MTNNFEGWKNMAMAPHDRRLIVWTGCERYVAHWVQHPETGEEAWLISEGPDGTQHLCHPIKWRGCPPPPPPVLDDDDE